MFLYVLRHLNNLIRLNFYYTDISSYVVFNVFCDGITQSKKLTEKFTELLGRVMVDN